MLVVILLVIRGSAIDFDPRTCDGGIRRVGGNSRERLRARIRRVITVWLEPDPVTRTGGVDSLQDRKPPKLPSL
jgi:hypothetical protein